MDNKVIYKLCKELGCCDRCCYRYMGLKNSKAYENAQHFLPENKDDTITEEEPVNNGENRESDSPPPKRQKGEICVNCVGLLQEESWPEWLETVKQIMIKKKYECRTYAIALSAPLAITFREKVICLRLKDAISHFEENDVVALREAWKWSFGTKLSSYINLELVPGDVSPLLFTLNFEYPNEQEELELLKTLIPKPFQEKRKQRCRKISGCEFTRRPVSEAVDELTLAKLKGADGWSDGVKPVVVRVKCVSVVSEHAPIYLGGRYIKLSRELPQTPWTVRGQRLMDTSIQEIIFKPLAEAYGMTEAEAERRLKFMAAGREDVDVRCLGDGRPFAIEVADPHRVLRDEELKHICDQIAQDGRVLVHRLINVDKEDLAELKKGEESKSKTYEALCVKLTPCGRPAAITDEDINRINEVGSKELEVHQKTPIRVLHRRPLLVRSRRIHWLRAYQVAPELFVLRLRTSAGTYIKEWCHGEVGRTRPALADAVQAPVDILRLDVVDVHLDWPHIAKDPRRSPLASNGRPEIEPTSILHKAQRSPLASHEPPESLVSVPEDTQRSPLASHLSPEISPGCNP